MIGKFKNALDIQFDGTFTVVPKILYQPFTVCIDVKGHTLPGFHNLMNAKTEKLYRAVLVTIRSFIPGFNPTFGMVDFEQAPRNALSVVFPSVTII